MKKKISRCCNVRRFLLLSALVVVSATDIQGAATKGAADQEIRAVMSAQVAAWNRGDIDGFMNGYARSDATEFVAGDKLTRGWQTVRDRYKKEIRQPREDGDAHFLRDKNHAGWVADAALVLGRWKLAREKRQAAWRFHSALSPHLRRLAHRPRSYFVAAETRGRLQSYIVEALQRYREAHASTLQRFNASTLQRFNASTLQRFNASTLQRSQPLQQLPVDPVKPAVAENRHDVLRFQQRHEPLYNMSHVRLVKRRAA